MRASMWPGRRLLNLDVGMSPQLIDRGAQHLGTFVPAPKTGVHSSVTTVSSQRCRLKKSPLLYRYGGNPSLTEACRLSPSFYSLRQVRQIKPSESQKPRRAASHGQQERAVWSPERWFPVELGARSPEPGAHTESWEPELEGIP